jgi:hypothetical protein
MDERSEKGIGTMTETKKLSDLAGSVKISNKYGASLAWDKQDEWQQNANSWSVTLRYRGRQFTADFFQGPAITSEPTVAGVLSCLLRDAQAGDNTFEDFCGEMGYDEDSRKAERIWKSCQKIAENLQRLLGDEYESFLYAENDI